MPQIIDPWKESKTFSKRDLDEDYILLEEEEQIPQLRKDCLITTPEVQDITSYLTSVSSICTYFVRYNSLPPCPLEQTFFLPTQNATDIYSVLMTITAPPPVESKSEWINFSESLFPGYRQYTPQESQAYSNFINSFFEEVKR